MNPCNLVAKLGVLLHAINSRPPWWRPVRRWRWYRALQRRAAYLLKSNPTVEFEQLLSSRYRTETMEQVNYDIARPVLERVIDAGPAEPLRDEDCNWGEQDSLANVPRRGASMSSRPLYAGIVASPSWEDS